MSQLDNEPRTNNQSSRGSLGGYFSRGLEFRVRKQKNNHGPAYQSISARVLLKTCLALHYISTVNVSIETSCRNRTQRKTVVDLRYHSFP